MDLAALSNPRLYKTVIYLNFRKTYNCPQIIAFLIISILPKIYQNTFKSTLRFSLHYALLTHNQSKAVDSI